MKVLLTVPMNRPARASVGINDNGLGYCAAAFRDAGADVTLFSWNVNMSLDMFRDKIQEIQPKIVGIKAFTMNFSMVYETLQAVRETLPDVITIIGGPHPSTSRPDDIFIEFGDLLDYAIAGDGELGILELKKLISASGGRPAPEGLSSVPGLIYRNGDRVKSNPKGVDTDLEQLPKIDWSLQNPSLFERNLTAGVYITNENMEKPDTKTQLPPAFFHDSRGCHERCGHCGSWLINGGAIRKRRLESLIGELDELINKHGARVLEFTGNELFYDKEYVEALCQWLINLDVPVRWGCTGGPNVLNLNDPDLLELMHRAGCTIMHFGIESGSPAVRKKENKVGTLEELNQIIKLALSKGIRVEGGFMFGFPEETLEDMYETIRYSMSLPFSALSYVICLPVPGTSSYEAVLKKYRIDRIDWSTFNFTKPKLLPTQAPIWQVYWMWYLAKILRKFRIAAGLFRRFNRIKF